MDAERQRPLGEGTLERLVQVSPSGIRFPHFRHKRPDRVDGGLVLENSAPTPHPETLFAGLGDLEGPKCGPRAYLANVGEPAEVEGGVNLLMGAHETLREAQRLADVVD
ncbi:hypothetical protein PG994_006736 [Apiospora phragmitis]|uniref:Uncharacterized protein n=1 Tax=Apiospora phragmitis TaxID=2905665 RepID=A0ABR1VFX4_9PEZI